MRSLLPFMMVPVLIMAVIALGACSKGSPGMAGGASDYRQVALLFAESLAARDYPKAYGMTSPEYRQGHTVGQLQAQFEAIVPPDWGTIGSIEVGRTMTNWPNRQPDDLGWAYVSIGGDVYSEAVVVVVASSNGSARVRHVEFGRP